MNLHRRFGLLALWICSITITIAETPPIVPLWPAGAPGAEGKSSPENVRVTPNGEQVVSNIHQPSLTPYLPPAGQATTAAVLIAPGGGHRELWMDHEGRNLAKWLQDRGIAAFVLKYRLARETNSTYKVDEHAMADTRRAIRLIRSRATDWGVNPSRLGILGFSAGGELAALASMQFDGGIEDAKDPIDRQSSKPDFQALIYPGSSRRFAPAKDSPPAFIVAGYGDRPDISRGMAEVYLKFKEAGVPAELHIYSNAGHGFGVRESTTGAVSRWPARFEEWLNDRGFLKKP